MTRRIMAVLAALLMVLGLVAVVNASSAQATTTNHTAAATMVRIRSVNIGPNTYTYWGQANITSSWTTYIDCSNHKHYVPSFNMSYHPPVSPVTRGATSASAKDPRVITPEVPCTPGGPIRGTGGTISPMCSSWWNPFCWDWSSIWGHLWAQIQGCINGVTHGVMGTLTLNAAASALAEGATLIEFSPGFAAFVAISGCYYGITW